MGGGVSCCSIWLKKTGTVINGQMLKKNGVRMCVFICRCEFIASEKRGQKNFVFIHNMPLKYHDAM